MRPSVAWGWRLNMETENTFHTNRFVWKYVTLYRTSAQLQCSVKTLWNAANLIFICNLQDCAVVWTDRNGKWWKHWQKTPTSAARLSDQSLLVLPWFIMPHHVTLSGAKQDNSLGYHLLIQHRYQNTGIWVGWMEMVEMKFWNFAETDGLYSRLKNKVLRWKPGATGPPLTQPRHSASKWVLLTWLTLFITGADSGTQTYWPPFSAWFGGC